MIACSHHGSQSQNLQLVTLRQQAVSAAVAAEYLYPCRYHHTARLLQLCSTSLIHAPLRHVSAAAMQVDDVAPAECCGSTRSDKLITDYLSRHSANTCLKGHAVRQPLAALENLQAALSDLHVAYELKKPSKKTDSKPVFAHHSRPVAGYGVYQHNADARSREVQAEHSRAFTQRQSIMLQSHPIQCSPLPETASTSRASRVQATAHETECCLVQDKPAAFPSSAPLQTCCSLPDTIEQKGSILTSTSMAQDLTSESTPCRAGPVTAAYIPADLQYTAEHSPTVYCTPHGSSPTFARQTAFESPSPNNSEQWYSPGTILDTSSLSSHDDDTHLTGCKSSADHFLNRPDSPSLLYGRGSVFSVDVLGQENNVSSQWLAS